VTRRRNCPSAALAVDAPEVKVPESQLSSADLDPRRRRILFRAWHRGMREMDILYGQFADKELPGLPDAQLDELEALMDLPDRDVLMWLTGEAPLPNDYDTTVFRQIKAFHTHSGPINV
jgi:antitoxin CptB